MTAYNSMERRIAQHLRRFPKFKVYAKLLFQLLMYLSYKKGYSHKLYEDVHRIIKYSDTGETFFGYFAQSVEKKTALYITILIFLLIIRRGDLQPEDQLFKLCARMRTERSCTGRILVRLIGSRERKLLG